MAVVLWDAARPSGDSLWFEGATLSLLAAGRRGSGAYQVMVLETAGRGRARHADLRGSYLHHVRLCVMSGRKICQDVERFEKHSVRGSGGAGLRRGRRKGSSCT